jgi:hypothetical protein
MQVLSPQIAALFLLIGALLQGSELPANAKATSNDTALASAMPSATARGRGKPSGLMAFSPQPAREIANRFWRHDDLIEVKDRPRIAQEALCRMCAGRGLINQTCCAEGSVSSSNFFRSKELKHYLPFA